MSIDFQNGFLKIIFAFFSAYIQKTSTVIIKVLAVGKFTLYSMRRHLSSYGNVSLSEFIGGKISTYETHFPKGITTNFIVSLVLDYLEENAVPSYWMYLMMNFNHSNVIMNTILLMLFVVIVMNKSFVQSLSYSKIYLNIK